MWRNSNNWCEPAWTPAGSTDAYASFPMPLFLPLRRRRLFVFRPSPSLDGGLLLLWLSFANRACRSCTCATSRLTCSRNAAF